MEQPSRVGYRPRCEAGKWRIKMASECVMIMDTAGARTAARRADSGTGGAEQDGTKLRLWLRMLTCTHLIGTEVRRRLRAEFGTSLARFDVLAQEYVPGRELGIFYYRYPGSKHGRIFSVTDKRVPVVVGDGRRTVERLILGDSRAVCMAARYLEAQAGRLEEVPEAGEEIRLVELGTHCRGAIFRDGSTLMTDTPRC